MFSTLYDFCRDQGSIIGGLLALAAGYLVFRGTTRTADRQGAAANAQTEALRQQNRDLRNEGQRRQGRDRVLGTKAPPNGPRILNKYIGQPKEIAGPPSLSRHNQKRPAQFR